MHCKACDALLNEQEVVLKDKATGEYLDLCGECYLASQEAVHEAWNDNAIEIVDDVIETLNDKYVDNG